MRPSTFWLIVLGIAMGILLLGGFGIWHQNPQTSGTPPAPAELTMSAPAETQVTPAEPPAATLPQPAVPLPAAPAPNPAVALPSEAIDWERKMEDIINLDLEETAIAGQLLALMPQMPESNQVQAAELVIGLLPDESYAVVVPLLTNAAAPVDVLDIMMLDLLDRPAAVHLPLLLEIARDGSHPRREEARDYLGTALQQDHGADWTAWEQAVQGALREPEP